MDKKSNYKNIDEYISNFPESTQKVLNELRKFIKNLLPDAEEVISYGIAAFDMNGKHVVFFAGYKNHISIYPFPSGETQFKKYEDKYKTATGTIQFPLNEPLPYEIIKEIVEFRLQENLEKAKKS